MGLFCVEQWIGQISYKLTLHQTLVGLHPVFHVARLKSYVQGGANGMDLGAGLSPVMIDARPKYEVDCILCKCRNGNQRCFIVVFRGQDDSESQWMSKAGLKNAPVLFV